MGALSLYSLHFATIRKLCGIVLKFSKKIKIRYSEMPADYDTIIIGMGAAGCTAASTLSKAGKKVLALEAMDRIGGRVNTVPFGDGVVEIGAEIHGTEQSRVYNLAIQNNVSVVPQDIDFEVYRSDGTIGDKEVLNELLNFSLGVVDDPPATPEPLGQYITKRLKEYMRAKYPTLLADQDFMDNLLEFLDLVVDNYESSNSWNEVSTESKYTELGGHQHMSWHRHGYKTLFEILLNTYNNGPGYPNLDIKLKKEVTQISWSKDPSQDVVVTCKDGSSYRAKNAIVTVSLGVLKERHARLFVPSLPTEKDIAIDKMSIGVVLKIILQFEYNWFSNIPSFAYIWRDVDKKDVSAQDDWMFSVGESSSPMGCTEKMRRGHARLFSPALPQEKVTSMQKISMGVVGKVIFLFENRWFTVNVSSFSFLWRTEDRESLGNDEVWWLNICAASSSMGNPVSLTLWTVGEMAKLASIDVFTESTERENRSIGVVDKVVFLFPKPWWPDSETFHAFVWTGADRATVPKEDNWLTKIFGVSTPLGSSTALTMWTSGEGAKLVETLPEDVVKRKAMELLRRFMGKNRTIPEPIAMLRSSWYSNPYTRGSYTFDNLSTPQYPHARATLAEPLVDSSGTPRVLFAGEATDNTHFSTVHGATDTGFREANRLLTKAKL
ncbi:hypothetical protein HW555_013360 [Spodoptera exigua]|uniref:Amine oxidase domain-containing protein n=1 Tax=Spodoptera exigua TaxID=7107 RepID=A0A835KYR4_SPOEX|nr:hypothetical protein HW555_013360 [Spodoptera exigua]